MSTRFNATPGTTVRLKAIFFRNDAPFDPFSISQVEIRRRTTGTSSDLVDTILAVQQEATGIWFVDWPIALGELVGAYVDRWFFVQGSGDAEQTSDENFAVLADGAVGGGGYITISEIRDRYLPGSTLDDAEIQTLIDESTETIDYYCGDQFGADTTTVVADGTGAAWIQLPKIVRSVTTITITNIDGSMRELNVDDFVIKGRWLVHKNYQPPGRAGYRRDGCLICGCIFGDIFDRGQNNVSVSGTFGMYANVPAPIRKAAGLLVMYGGADDNRTGPMAFNYDSEGVEQNSYTRRPTTLESVKISGATGIPEVDSILNKFRNVRPRIKVF